MRRKGYSLIELIIALALVSVIALSLLPVLSTAVRQKQQLEDLRLQNQFTRNLVTAIHTDTSVEADEGSVYPFRESSAGARSFSYRGTAYTVSQIVEDDVRRVEIDREGFDETIRIIPKN